MRWIPLTFLAIWTLALVPNQTNAQCSVFDELELEDPAPGTSWGKFAVDGDHLLVSAVGDDSFGNDAGLVYAYRKEGDQWVFRQTFVAGETDNGDRFGSSLTLRGDQALIGAPNRFVNGNTFVGTCYLFRYDGQSWVEEQVIENPDPQSADTFGRQIALGEDVLIISAPGDDEAFDSAGAVHTFEWNGAAWVPVQKLIPEATDIGDFGVSIALTDSGSFAYVGMPGYNDAPGLVDIYDTSTWTRVKRLQPLYGEDGDNFGSALSLSEELLVVGTPGSDLAGEDVGAAYVYEANGWSLQRILTPSDTPDFGTFGVEVGFFGRVTFVRSASRGYYFEEVGSEWVEHTYLDSSDDRELTLDQLTQVSDSEFLAHWRRTNTNIITSFNAGGLVLNISPSAARANDRVLFRTCSGGLGQPVGLVLTAINEIPLFQPILVGSFTPNHEWDIEAVIPPGVSGLIATFQSVGFGLDGQTYLSNEAPLLFLF